MQRRGRFCWEVIVCAVLLLGATRAWAQVDWSDVFADEKPATPKKAVAPAKPSAPVVQEAEEAPPPKKAVKKAAPPPVEEAEEAPPPKKAVKKAAPPPVEEAEEAPPPKAVKKAAPPPVEEAEEAPPPKAVKKAAPPPVEEVEEAPPPKAVKKAAPPPVEEAEEAPPPKAAKRPVAVEEEAELAPAKPAAKGGAPATGGLLVSLADVDLSEGDVVNASNMAQHAKLLPPGLEWAVRYGWRLPVTEPKHVELPTKFREATEKYSGQVRLGKGGLSIENHTAGLPFPRIDTNDPMVAQKIMWNFYYNIAAIDDEMQRGIDTYTGPVSPGRPVEAERHILTDSYRKLNYTGRVYIDPKPNLPNPEGVRYKESLHPLLEPFDLKGVGFTSYRYIDPNKQDDSWLYLPQLRRVRRMSTGQRSDALFGQDTDADAFAGYNGHIAWMDFTLLAEQTMLASLHSTHSPVKWQQPEDWMWDDKWEPRRVFVIEAVSKIPAYAYSKRVLFIDREAWIIPLADSYDRAGQLWKSHYVKWNIKSDPKSQNRDPAPAQEADLITDVQLQHVTSTGIPRQPNVPDGGYHSNVGEAMGVTEAYFTVADLIAGGH